MQTFLPFESFSLSARILDNKRLNKQIVEAYQILTDRVPNKNHPACLMWADCKSTLYVYFDHCCCEYERRFNKNHSLTFKVNPLDYTNTAPYFMEKINSPLFTLSHRVNLMRKDYNHYSQYIKLEHDISEYPQGYFWPIPNGFKSKENTYDWLDWWFTNMRLNYEKIMGGVSDPYLY